MVLGSHQSIILPDDRGPVFVRYSFFHASFAASFAFTSLDDSYLHRTIDASPGLVALSPLTNSPPVFRDRLLIGRLSQLNI